MRKQETSLMHLNSITSLLDFLNSTGTSVVYRKHPDMRNITTNNTQIYWEKNKRRLSNPIPWLVSRKRFELEVQCLTSSLIYNILLNIKKAEIDRRSLRGRVIRSRLHLTGIESCPRPHTSYHRLSSPTVQYDTRGPFTLWTSQILWR